MIKVRCGLCKRHTVIAKKANRLYCDDCVSLLRIVNTQVFFDYRRLFLVEPKNMKELMCK